jgi:glycine C-acetyltransferase
LILKEGSTPEFFNVMKDVDIYVGAFGKALGNDGGFISASKELIDYFKFSLRSQIFGRSLSILTVISALFKLEILEKDSRPINTLWKNTRSLQHSLRSLGANIGATMSAITPIYLKGDANDGVKLIYKLREEHGIFCSGVTYPVTPRGTNLLRLVPTALHTEEDITQTLKALSKELDLASLNQTSFEVSEGNLN